MGNTPLQKHQPRNMREYKQLTDQLKKQLIRQSTKIYQLQKRCQCYQKTQREFKRKEDQMKLKIAKITQEKESISNSSSTVKKDTQIHPIKSHSQIGQSVHSKNTHQNNIKTTQIIRPQRSSQGQVQNVSSLQFSPYQPVEQQQKAYIKSSKKWKDFKIHPDIIEALKVQKKNKPNSVQAEVLETFTYQDRKKFNYLIRAPYGTGKTFSCLITLVNALRPGLKSAQDKVFRGKVIANQVFKPQGVIIIQNNILQQRIESILKQFLQYGQKTKSQKINFKLGRLDKQGHTHGDIIICQAKSFLNRHQRGNMSLQQCKFVVIDQIDDFYHHDKDSLAKVLQIVRDTPNTNFISCSQTMEKKFISFYEENGGKFETNKETSKYQKNRVFGSINNYYVSVEGGEQALHKYVIKNVFKALYSDTTKLKPQIFVFFNSIEEINRFSQIFETIASDFTSHQSKYLKGISKGIIAPKTFKDGKKEAIRISQKNEIMQKFRNNETNVLLATNIIARVDVRNAVLVINVGVPKRNQKDDSIDVDTYIQRARIVGRQTDRGVALTITEPQTKMPLIQGLKKVHKLQIKELKNAEDLVKQVWECIENNSKA